MSPPGQDRNDDVHCGHKFEAAKTLELDNKKVRNGPTTIPKMVA
jgi:hypothetical protein